MTSTESLKYCQIWEGKAIWSIYESDLGWIYNNIMIVVKLNDLKCRQIDAGRQVHCGRFFFFFLEMVLHKPQH